MSYSQNYEGIGTCYMCGFECNPCSQTCGMCARNMTMSALGWDVCPRTPKWEDEEKSVKKETGVKTTIVTKKP